MNNQIIDTTRTKITTINVNKPKNLDKLAKFSLLSPKRLTGLKFTEFFLWLSRSVSCISKAAPNAPELFDDTGDWDEGK